MGWTLAAPIRPNRSLVSANHDSVATTPIFDNLGQIHLMRKNHELWEPEEGAAFCLKGFPLVQFDRKPIDPDLLTGFVLAFNAKLTLLQKVDENQFLLDGYSVFRNSDVKRWRSIQPEEFFAKAAKLNKLRPSHPPNVTLASMRDAFSSAGAEFPLLAVHREHLKRGVCEVGKLRSVTQRRAKLHSISPQAEWETEETFVLNDVTLLEFGGAYERLLASIAKSSDPV